MFRNEGMMVNLDHLVLFNNNHEYFITSEFILQELHFRDDEWTASTRDIMNTIPMDITMSTTRIVISKMIDIGFIDKLSTVVDGITIHTYRLNLN